MPIRLLPNMMVRKLRLRPIFQSSAHTQLSACRIMLEIDVLGDNRIGMVGCYVKEEQ